MEGGRGREEGAVANDSLQLDSITMLEEAWHDLCDIQRYVKPLNLLSDTIRYSCRLGSESFNIHEVLHFMDQLVNQFI